VALLKRCAACGGAIRKEDVRSKRAVREDGNWYCRQCADLIRDPASPSEGIQAVLEPDADGSPDDVTVELSLHPVQKRVRNARRALDRREAKRETAEARNWTLYVAAGAILAALAIIVLLLILGR
jgi:hypothetical protein